MPEIVISPVGQPPFAVELMVFEEDTWMVLSAGNFARSVRQDTHAVIEEMNAFETRQPGELVIKGNRAYAIVHDLDQGAGSRVAWIDLALDRLFTHCRTTGTQCLAMQPLGCVHGEGDIDEFCARLRAHPQACNLRIWVVA